MQQLSRARTRGEDGIITAHLAVVIAFALFAVIELTRTTVAAQQIDTRVRDIVGSVSSVNTKTGGVAVLNTTDALTTQILAAAQPLSGQAGQIVDAARSIDGHVADILGTATAINSTAGSINTTVNEINGNAAAINLKVGSILGSFQNLQPVVVGIRDGVIGINQRADSVIALSSGIKGDTGNILAVFDRILLHANSIDCSPEIHGQACQG